MFVLHARDLQSAPKMSNEGLEILYTMPNLFVLSFSQSAWWGKELVGNFYNYTILLKKLCHSLSLFELTQHNVLRRTEILWHWHCLVENRRDSGLKLSRYVALFCSLLLKSYARLPYSVSLSLKLAQCFWILRLIQ